MTQDVPGHVQRVADVGHALLGRVDELTDDIYDVVVGLIPDLRADVTGIHRDSIRENLETALDALATSLDSTEARAPAAAVEYSRALARSDVPLTALIQAYRVGQMRFLRACIEELLDTSSEDAVDVLATLLMVESVSTRLDRVVEQVYAEYEQARELAVRDRSAVLAGRVRDLLRRRSVDVDDAERALSYRLRRSHVGLVVWTKEGSADALARLRRFTSELGRAVGCDDQCLFVAHDERSAWAWAPTKVDVARAPELVDIARAEPTVSAAVGEPGRDVGGFCRTHQQALSAQSVAHAAGPDHPQIIPFAEVAPIAMLCTDLDAARAWVHETLGDLAVDTTRNAGLRETARVFLETGGSYTATADRLFLHRNTAQYRMRQAEQVRGRPLRDRRLDVELALVACHWMDGAVLQPAP